MTVKIDIELTPIKIPNYILVKPRTCKRQEGFNPNVTSYHVSELDKKTLTKLCDEFKTALFLKAGVEE